jgi:transcriptional regulator with XRE-family HTH domain
MDVDDESLSWALRRPGDHPWTGERIRELRLRLGLTQEDLAQRLGARSSTVCRWERGRRVPMRVYQHLLDELDRYEADPGPLRVRPRGKPLITTPPPKREGGHNDHL